MEEEEELRSLERRKKVLFLGEGGMIERGKGKKKARESRTAGATDRWKKR